MQVSLVDLSNLSNVEIYNLVKDDLDTFYSNYNNIVIGKKEFIDIALEEIEDLKKEESNSSLFLSKLLNKIEKRIKQEININSDPNYQIFLNDIKKYRVLSTDEIKELVPLAQSGDKEAMQKLVRHNLKLVLSVSKRFLGLGVDLEDLVQEGTIGLIDAIKRFNVNKGTRFSTYAMFWIKSKLFRTVYYDSRNIRLPVDRHEQIVKYKKTYSELFEKLNREPTIDEIAKCMRISYKKCLGIFQILSDTISLNKKINDDESEDSELVFFVESDENIEQLILRNSLKDDIGYTLFNSKLTEKEIYAVVHRFGLFENKKMTLDEVGKILKVTRERVRQLEKTGLKKMGISESGKKLSIYLYDGNRPKREEDNKESKSIDNDEYKNIRSKISDKMFNYFYECGLTSLEMLVISLSFGLIDNKIYGNTEISTIIKKPHSYISQVLNNVISKLKQDENRVELFAHAEKLLSKNKDKSNNIAKKNIYEVIGCTEKEYNYAIRELSSSELNLLNKRKSKTYRGVMSREEITEFNKVLLVKIRGIIQNYRNSQIKKSKEFKSIKDSINKNKDEKDSELYSILERISDTKLFRELNKQFSIKETIAIILLDSYSYKADYVAKLLNMSLADVNKAYKKATIALKYINVEEVDKVKKLIINKK